MLLRFEQIHRQPTPRYTVYSLPSEQQLGQGEALGVADARLQFNGKQYALDHIVSPEGSAHPVGISADGTAQGNIQVCFHETKRVLGLFSTGYDYRCITLNENRYTVYEVSVAPNKRDWYLYRDDQTLCAVIRKRAITINTLDVYTLFIEDEQDADAVCLMALFIDCEEFENLGNVTGMCRTDDDSVTLQKELRAKYDPDFVRSICTRAGLTEDQVI